MFLRNHWYVAAWSHEVSREPLARVLLNEPVVFYRREDGSPVALQDRCCHRGYPLSRGTLQGDDIRCGYHGMVFRPDGVCIRIPGQQTIPPAARVPTYPVAERYGWLWIWMGDPALADPAKITDFHWLDDPAWGAQGTVFHVKADYRLVIDNLLDLTHLAYVHGTTIGNAAVAEKAQVSFELGEEDVQVARWTLDAPPPPTYVRMVPFKGNVDRWQLIHWTPPAFVRLYTGAADAGTGAPQGNRVGGLGFRNLNAMTPETARTTHYFWGQAQDVAPQDPALTELSFEQVKTAFLEDVVVFEAQQRNLDLLPDAPLVGTRGDAGGLHARRIIQRLLDEEAAQAAPVRSAAE